MALTYKEADDFIAAFLAMRNNAGDDLASMAVSLYPEMNYDGSLISVGTRINWNGAIKKAAVDLWDTEENNPENAPSLWQNIEYKHGYRLIPEVITVTTAFAKGECGWWDDKLYKSLLDANVYTPAIYPAGWELVD